MARYKIDIGLLESVKNNIQLDKDKFTEAVNSFNSFMMGDSNTLSRDITQPLNSSCVTITEGFKLLVDWLNEYIAAVQETENKAQTQITQIVEDKFNFGISIIPNIPCKFSSFAVFCS